jgi:hypothetical protein
MQQVVQHYGSNPSVGYIRFGLAQGGETSPSLAFNSDSTCSNAFAGWGWTPTNWIDYLTSMLGYEATLNSPKQLMVGLNTVTSTSVPDQVAAYAVSQNIGFGSQGLQQSDISNFDSGAPCTADWCSLFDTYQGQVAPLELQTATQSDSNGGGVTGSLVPLLPFAVEHHATSLELYYEDWLTAFDPSYPGYYPSYVGPIQSAAAQGTQLQVVFPPISGSDASSIQTYVMNNQAAPATGAVMLIQWANVDQGPSANPQYVWTSVDSAIQPWVAAGKKVNLVVWPVADSASNTATPAYVLNSLGSTNTTTCNNGSGQ